MKAGFIPDIYNYCDRWCEKCECNTSCLYYRLELKAEERGEELPLDRILEHEAQLWDQIKSYLYSENEENKFADLSPEIFPETDPEESEVEYYINMLDLLRLTLIYEVWAEKTLEETYSVLDELPESEREKTEAVTDAVECVNWYLDVIQPKIRRAMYDYYHGDKETASSVPYLDYNGSVKVALLSAEKSGKAWRQLTDLLPAMEKAGEHLQVVLSELRKEILKQFPFAMEFQRPGFDS